MVTQGCLNYHNPNKHLEFIFFLYFEITKLTQDSCGKLKLNKTASKYLRKKIKNVVVFFVNKEVDFPKLDWAGGRHTARAGQRQAACTAFPCLP